MKPFISLCMIVKDEGKVLDRCLSSIENLIDEIIIVDTGSTDNTKEIATKYTSEIYDFEWINDFSAARNFAASKANGEWILVLDADEYIDEQNFKGFIDELNSDNGKYDCYSVKIINFAGNFGENTFQNHHARVYKNNGKIHYYRNIHEQLISNEDKTLTMKNSSLLVFHSGYLSSTVKEKDKNERNTNLINLELKNGGNNPFDYYNFGNEYGSIGDYEKALEYYLKAYKFKSDIQLSWVPHTVFQIINCLIKLKRYSDAINVINDAKNMYPNSPEFPFLQGEVFLSRGQLDDAKQVYKQILNEQQKYSHIILRPDLKDLKPHTRLGEIFYSEENFNDSIYHYVSVLNINKYDSEAINKVIDIFVKFHKHEEIYDFLHNNNLINEKNIPIYIRACFNVGNPGLAIKLLEDYAEEHKLLTNVAKLKELLINNQGNIEEIKDIFTTKVLTKLIESNWINLVDLRLLWDYTSDINELAEVLNSLELNEDMNKVLRVLFGKEKIIDIEIDNNFISYILDLSFIYKNIDLCNLILDEIENTSESTIKKVARILFKNGYKKEALELYSLCEWTTNEVLDFENIIKGLIEIDNLNDALNVSQFASKITNDFRFYKYIIQFLYKTGKNDKAVEYIENALLEFPDSYWLRDQYIES